MTPTPEQIRAALRSVGLTQVDGHAESPRKRNGGRPSSTPEPQRKRKGGRPKSKPEPDEVWVVPTPKQVKSARLEVKLSQTKAGRKVNRSLRAWQSWEWGEEDMPPELWELFNLKVKGRGK